MASRPQRELRSANSAGRHRHQMTAERVIALRVKLFDEAVKVISYASKNVKIGFQSSVKLRKSQNHEVA